MSEHDDKLVPGAQVSPVSGSAKVIAPDLQRDRNELNKAKRAAKKARSRARETAESAKRAAKKEDKRRQTAAFRATIQGDYVVDETGKPIRRYTLAERILDNKVISYSIAIGFLLVCLLGVLFMPRG
jgi:hypothetical protein